MHFALSVMASSQSAFNCVNDCSRARISSKVPKLLKSVANAVASEATTKRLTPEVFAQYPISEMLRQPDVWLENLGRITHPMIRREGADYYKPISWDDAFELIGGELRALSSPNEAIFYTSG